VLELQGASSVCRVPVDPVATSARWFDIQYINQFSLCCSYLAFAHHTGALTSHLATERTIIITLVAL
jgi:hypothetical protein